MGNAGQTRLFINNVSWASIWSKWAMPARHYPAPHYEADNAEIKAKWNSKCPINLTRAVRADILEYCHLVAMVNGHVCANFMSGFNLRPFVRHIPENKWQWGNETVLFSLLMNISYKQNMFQISFGLCFSLPIKKNFDIFWWIHWWILAFSDFGVLNEPILC